MSQLGPGPRAIAGAIVLSAIAACGGPNAGLADLQGLRVSVDGGRNLDDGIDRVQVHLAYDGVDGSVPHDCAVLGYVDATINGIDFDDVRPGEWRDTSLAGSTPYCVSPSFFVTHAPFSAAGTSVITLADDSGEVTVEITDFFAERSIARVGAPDAVLHPGDVIDLTPTVVATDVLAPGRATADLPGQQCSHSHLLDLTLDPSGGGYSFTVPDWVDLQFDPEPHLRLRRPPRSRRLPDRRSHTVGSRRARDSLLHRRGLLHRAVGRRADDAGHDPSVAPLGPPVWKSRACPSDAQERSASARSR